MEMGVLLGKCFSVIFVREMTCKIRFDHVDPTRFRIGDVVEVQGTAVAVPIKNNRFKMILQLRALALLDGRFTDVRNTRLRWVYIFTDIHDNSELLPVA
jgi:hypothetical protein